MHPFFSIIIPTLNEENYLPRLLDSLIKQKIRNFEVVVVDAMSEDRTLSIINNFKHLISIQIITVNNKNVSCQRNLGAKQARGEWLFFLDADSYIRPKSTKIAQEYIKKHHGLIYIPYFYPQENKQYPDIKLVTPIVNELVGLSQNLERPFSAGGTMIWEKNFFQLIGGFNEKILVTEDHEIIRRARQWGVRAKIIKPLKVRFSLRRLKREGRLVLFYKVIVSHLYLLFNPKIKKKLFEYEMGGYLYTKKRLKTNIFDETTIKNQISKTTKSIHDFFRTLLQE